MFAAINWTLVSDGDGSSSSSTRLERLVVLAGDLLSFLGVAHFRGLGVLRLGTKVLLTILKRTRDYFKFDRVRCHCIQHESTNWEHLFTSPTVDGAAILRGHSSHTKV